MPGALSSEPQVLELDASQNHNRILYEMTEFYAFLMGLRSLRGKISFKNYFGDEVYKNQQL